MTMASFQKEISVALYRNYKAVYIWHSLGLEVQKFQPTVRKEGRLILNAEFFKPDHIGLRLELDPFSDNF